MARRYVIRIARRAGIIALFVLAALLGIATGVIFAYAGDLPQISALDDYAPSTISRVYGAHGEIVGEFAIQRREVIPYEAISPKLKQAILAAEDSEFEQHFGLSIPRIIVTLIKDIIERTKAAGASTLTQQLARKLFLTDEKTWERKIKEALLAIQIEKRYTKHEIFTLYCNQMYFGHGVYGVEAASRLYFGKSAKDLTLEEAALIAGILQGNVRQSPYVNMDAALRRRNYTLGRMADVGFITADEAEAAQEEARSSVAADPPTQAVRGALLPRRGPQGARGALRRQAALRERPVDPDGARPAAAGGGQPRRSTTACAGSTSGAASGSRAATSSPKATPSTPSGIRAGTGRWRAGDIVPAVVTGRRRRGDSVARAGALRVTIDRKGYRVDRQDQRRRSSSTPGDLVETRLLTVDEAAHAATGTLEQPPAVEGAVLAIDNRTGQIRAMVGGYSFERSKFNRATQAYRQVGSAFKPIVYTAAIDRGYTPVTMLMDTPASFSGGAGQPAYAPLNYDQKFEGPITLRHALEQSRNVPAVRVMEQLGPTQVIAYARRLGLESPLPPYLAVALGAAEATLDRDDQRLLGVPEPGRADAAVLGAEGHRPRRQRARGEPAGAEGRDPRRHRVRDDQPAARRRAARHRGQGGGAQLAARRQDRHDRRLHRRLVHRLRSGHHDRACGSATTRSSRWARPAPAPSRRCRSGSTS